MEDRRPAVAVFAAILLIALGSIVAFFFSGTTTGSVSTYQQVQHVGGVQNQPDPHTQYITIDDGMCTLVQERYVTFLTRVDRLCQEMNHGRQKREADCRYQAELEAELKCRSAPVFENVRPPEYLTGMIPVDPLGCAVLAEEYDYVLLQTFERAGTPEQTIAMLNPCTDTAEAATRLSLDAEAPLREYVRTAFPDGSIMGNIAGEDDAPGKVRYVRCSDGTARVVVSGVPMCNTLG